jgi:hypothetical protein
MRQHDVLTAAGVAVRNRCEHDGSIPVGYG